MLVKLMQLGTTINAAVYCDTLQRLRSAIHNKGRGMSSSGIVLIHDNARSHTAGVLDGSSNNFNHPPYIPDLVTSKFHLFPELKTWLGGQRFQTKEVLRDNVNAHLTSLAATVFEEGIGKLVYRYDK